MRAYAKGTLIPALVVVFGLVFCGGCNRDRSSGGSGHLAISQISSTMTGTSELAGARDVPLLGLRVGNNSWGNPTIGTIRLRGKGDLSEVERVSLFRDSNGDRRISPGDQRIWTGRFNGQEVVADNLSITIPAGLGLNLIFAIDIAAGAADGTSVRGSSRHGDLRQSCTSHPLKQKWEPLNLVSGWRTVGGPGSPDMNGLVVVGGDDLARLDPTGSTPPMTVAGGWQADGGIAVDPEGRWVVLASGSSPELVTLNMRAMTVTARTFIQDFAHSVIPGPMGDRVYVSHERLLGAGRVVEFIVIEDLTAARIGRTFLYGDAEPGLLAINASGDRLYLAESSGGVRVIDIPSGTELAPLNAPPAVAIDITPDGSRLLVVGASGDVLSIPVDGSPPSDSSTGDWRSTWGFDVAVSIDGTEAYVLDVGVVHVIDPIDLSPIEDRPFPGTGTAVAAGSSAGEAIVLDDGGCLFVLEAGVPAREAVAPSGIQVWSMGVAE